MESPTSPSLSLSRTGPGPTVRFPAPDVARGFMLLLIAVANIYWWFPSTTVSGTVDQWWIVARTALIDQRSYPLFAMLLGYGIAMIALRRAEAGVGEGPIRRLLRRRGWWMLLFGFVHAIVFGGDIIGAYALIVLIIAGSVARGRLVGITIFGAVVWLVSFVLDGVLQFSEQTMVVAGDGRVEAPPVPEPGSADLFWIPFNLVTWFVASPMTVIASMVLPATVIGVWIARTTLLSEPERHLSLLWTTAVGGLAIGFAGGFTAGLHRAGLAEGGAPVWATSFNSVSQLVGAVGWLSVAALIGAAIRNRSSRNSFTPVGLVLAVGRRSMTAYLLQTVVFLALVIALRVSGVHDELTLVAIAGISAGVWLVIALVCASMDSRGRQGPSEKLLRVLVSRGASARDTEVLTGRRPSEQMPPGNPA